MDNTNYLKDLLETIYYIVCIAVPIVSSITFLYLKVRIINNTDSPLCLNPRYRINSVISSCIILCSVWTYLIFIIARLIYSYLSNGKFDIMLFISFAVVVIFLMAFMMFIFIGIDNRYLLVNNTGDFHKLWLISFFISCEIFILGYICYNNSKKCICLIIYIGIGIGIIIYLIVKLVTDSIGLIFGLTFGLIISLAISSVTNSDSLKLFTPIGIDILIIIIVYIVYFIMHCITFTDKCINYKSCENIKICFKDKHRPDLEFKEELKTANFEMVIYMDNHIHISDKEISRIQDISPEQIDKIEFIYLDDSLNRKIEYKTLDDKIQVLNDKIESLERDIKLLVGNNIKILVEKIKKSVAEIKSQVKEIKSSVNKMPSSTKKIKSLVDNNIKTLVDGNKQSVKKIKSLVGMIKKSVNRIKSIINKESSSTKKIKLSVNKIELSVNEIELLVKEIKNLLREPYGKWEVSELESSDEPINNKVNINGTINVDLNNSFIGTGNVNLKNLSLEFKSNININDSLSKTSIDEDKPLSKPSNNEREEKTVPKNNLKRNNKPKRNNKLTP